MDPTDPTKIRGVDSRTALYVDQQLDPLRITQAVHNERIRTLEDKVKTLFALFNGGKKATAVTAGGGGLAGIVYIAMEFMKDTPQ